MTGSIILDTCRDHSIDPAHFFNPRARDKYVLACRIEAIARLRAAEFCNAGIARAMRRNYDTIRYWVNPSVRKRKTASMRRYMARKNA